MLSSAVELIVQQERERLYEQVQYRVKTLVDTYRNTLYEPDRLLIAESISRYHYESLEFTIGVFLLRVWQQMLVNAAIDEELHR